jgi:hypothetical protein
MRDKSLGIWLMVLFGISGMAIIMLAWLWPALQSERIVATLTGSVGLAVATVHALMLRQSTSGKIDEQVPLKVEVEDKS